MTAPRLHPLSILTGALLVALPMLFASMQRANARDVLTAEEKAILSHMSLVFLDDGTGNEVLETIRLTGANLQLVNGLGATNGAPDRPQSTDPSVTRVNGLGNLIVGYNEVLNSGLLGNVRTGSHSIVTGIGSSYDSFGALVAGAYNAVSGPFGSALGGENNSVFGEHSVVVGGGNSDSSDGNVASGNHNVVVGGANNTAAGAESVVVGGFTNTVSTGTIDGVVVGGFNNLVARTPGSVFRADSATIVGGVSNLATGLSSVVVGGQDNEASALGSVVTGGQGNEADGSRSTVSVLNTSGNTDHDWVGGSLSEDD